jgi:DNA-binding SARP family transcriptional activator
MRIGLLGPLDVSSQGAEIRIQAALQRSLLAALAVRAGDVVPVDSLAKAIWDARPPATWTVTLRNYVRRLRLAFGPDNQDRIVTRPPGYLLRVDRGDIDLFAFENFRKAGMAAARAADWRLASAKFGEAESLWRGTPFADVPSRPITDTHVPYLQEARLAVQEARLHADLQLSPLNAASVAPELQRLAMLHPAREHLRLLLMLALYRSGRQSDALAAYREAWQFSTSELGTEPGPALKAMHQRMLAGDPGLRQPGVFADDAYASLAFLVAIRPRYGR